MKVRHKTPTLVSMWMLDVFCCALGCVTFLWLLNTRQATDQTVAAQSAQTRLDRTRTELTDTIKQLAGLNAESERLAARLRAALEGQSGLAAMLLGATQDGHVLQGKLAESNRLLNAVRAEAKASKADLASAQVRSKNLEAELLTKKQQIDDLTKQVSAASTKVETLAKDLKAQSAAERELEAKYLALQKELKDLEKQLAAAETKLAGESATAKSAAAKAKTDLEAAKSDSAKAAQELAAAKKTITALERQVAAAGTDKAQIIDLQGQNAKLANKIDQLQKETESRFAGIAMTGRSVAFVVDISGSMNNTDEKTPNAAKWPLVCDTVSKVMRSIPTLERYQVVVFSSKARWLLDNTGNWRPYEGEKSIGEVKTEMMKIVPVDDTNLYSAFEMAFSLRAKGLDTIYLFSDGLPTSGAGLSSAQETLPDDKRSELLSDYLLRDLRQRWNRPLGTGERVRVNSVGFFYQSPSVGAFLWNLSRENDGSFVGMSKP